MRPARPTNRIHASGAGTLNPIARDEDPNGEFRYPLEESFGHLIRDAHRAFNRAMQVRLERHDVTVGQWAFLRILWEQDGLTQRELAEMLGLMEPSAMFALNGLDKRGLIKRVQDPRDGRKRRIQLTPKGRALRRELVPYAMEVNAIALGAFDPVHARQLIHSVIDNLQRDIVQQTGDSPAAGNRRQIRRRKVSR